MADPDSVARFESVRLLLVDLEGAISVLSRYGRRCLPGSIGLAISGISITGGVVCVCVKLREQANNLTL